MLVDVNMWVSLLELLLSDIKWPDGVLIHGFYYCKQHNYNNTGLPVCSYNCCLIKSSIHDIVRLCDSYDIICLQEHWLPNECYVVLVNSIRTAVHATIPMKKIRGTSQNNVPGWNYIVQDQYDLS